MWRWLELEDTVKISAWRPKAIMALELFRVRTVAWRFFGVAIFQRMPVP